MLCLAHPRLNTVVRPKLAAFITGVCLSVLAVCRASAQNMEWSDRAFLNLNTTLQVTSTPLADTLAPVIYAERAVLTTTHTGKGGRLAIEPAGGLRLWRSLGAGAALERRAIAETATVRALVPHPTLFNQPRIAIKDVPFERTDVSVHAYALLMVPLYPRLDVAVLAGPSFINVRQDILGGIQVAETAAPFSAVNISDVGIITRTVRSIGVNAGADVTWFLKPTAGIGVTVRYVRGSAGMPLTDGTPTDLDIGGLRIGMGARLRFR